MKRLVPITTALALASPAMANVIGQNQYFGPASGVPPSAVTFSQFDSSLGTLNSVTIQIDASIGGETSVKETCRFGCGVDLTPSGGTTSTLTLDLTPYGLSDLTLSSTNPWSVLFSTDLASGGSETLTDFFMSANLETLLIETTLLNPFIGTGAFSLDFASAIFNNISGPLTNSGVSWVVTNMSTWAQGQVGVQYDYTASAGTSGPDDLPEPSTLSLIGLGLLGLSAMRRRRLRLPAP